MASQSPTNINSSFSTSPIELRILRARQEENKNKPKARPRRDLCKKAGFVICTALLVVLLSLWMTSKDEVLPYIVKDDRDYDVTVDAESNRFTLHPKAGFDHKYSLIFMHGDHEADQASMLTQFLHQRDARMTPFNCKIILPQAPIKIVKKQGITKFKWYNIAAGFGKMKTLEERRNATDQEQLADTAQMLLGIVREEARLLGDPSKVFIGGINAGSVVALSSFLLYNDTIPLGGVIGVNAMYLMDDQLQITDSVAEVRKNTPMLQIYGGQQRFVPQSIFNESQAKIKSIYNGTENLREVMNKESGLNWDDHVAQGIAGWLLEKMPDV